MASAWSYGNFNIYTLLAETKIFTSIHVYMSNDAGIYCNLCYNIAIGFF